MRGAAAPTSHDVARAAGVSQPTVSRALRGDPRVIAGDARAGGAGGARARLRRERPRPQPVHAADEPGGRGRRGPRQPVLPRAARRAARAPGARGRADDRVHAAPRRPARRRAPRRRLDRRRRAHDDVPRLPRPSRAARPRLPVRAAQPRRRRRRPHLLLGRQRRRRLARRARAARRRAPGDRGRLRAVGDEHGARPRGRRAGRAVGCRRRAARRCAAGGYTYETGHTGASELLAGDDRPTALFCGNDVIALGALNACHRLGLRVPRGRERRRLRRHRDGGLGPVSG